MNWPQVRARTAPWLRPGLVVLLGVLAVVGTSAPDGSAIRVLMLLLFFVSAPGLALVGLLGIDEPWREAALVIGVSLALDLVVVTALAYSGSRTAGDALAVLVVIAVLGAVAQAVPAVRRHRERAAQ